MTAPKPLWYNIKVKEEAKEKIARTWRGWADDLEDSLPGVSVLGADWDHATIITLPSHFESVKAFLGQDFTVEANTDGNILCDAVDLSM